MYIVIRKLQLVQQIKQNQNSILVSLAIEAAATMTENDKLLNDDVGKQS